MCIVPDQPPWSTGGGQGRHTHSHGHGHNHGQGFSGHSHSHRCPYARPKDGGKHKVSKSFMLWGGRMAVLFATSAFPYGFYGAWRCIFMPYGLLDQPLLSFYALGTIFLHFCFTMFVFTYYLLVFSNPGYVPKTKKEEDRPTLEDAPAKGWCAECKSVKPPRAHHCRHCNRCVMRMDHHCPWINNCVGHYNMKNFTVFLIFGAITCIAGVILFSIRAIDLYRNADEYRGTEDGQQGVMVGILLFILVLFAVGMTGIAVSQIILVSTNTTTIERMNRMRKEHFKRFHKKKEKGMEKEEQQTTNNNNNTNNETTSSTSQTSSSNSAKYNPFSRWDSKYNLGVWLNLKQVYGRKVYTWLCPDLLPCPQVNGLDYPTKEK